MTDPCDLKAIRSRVDNWKEMYAYDPQEARDIDVLIAEVDRLREELMTVRGESSALQRKVDTHECVPTQWAYDQACKALHEHRARADAAEAKLRDEENAHNQTCEERDAFHEWADKLAAAIAPFEVRGEHSNGNNPWANALEYAERL